MASGHIGFGKVFLHLLGKTGSGKSSTGNTLLGRKCFPAKSSTSAVTMHIQRENSDMGVVPVEVVDGPGVMDAHTGVRQEAIRAFEEVIKTNQDDVHILVIVCRYGDPFTKYDKEMLDAIRKTFGQHAFWNHGIIMMTCGDNFTADTEDENIDFTSWCKGQTGVFSDLLQQCQGRIVLVENFKRSRDRDLNAVSCFQDILHYQLDRKAAVGSDLKPKHLFATIARVLNAFHGKNAKAWATPVFFALSVIAIVSCYRIYFS